MFNAMISCLLLIVVPIVIKYIVQWVIIKSKVNENKENEFSFLAEIKIFMLIVFILAFALAISCIEFNENNDIIDIIIYLMLPLVSLFPVLYTWGIKITLPSEGNCLKYRNPLFYTKQIFYKDIDYVQIRLKTLHIVMRNEKVIKVLDIDWIGGELIMKCLREYGVKTKKRKYKNDKCSQ